MGYIISSGNQVRICSIAEQVTGYNGCVAVECEQRRGDGEDTWAHQGTSMPSPRLCDNELCWTIHAQVTGLS